MGQVPTWVALLMLFGGAAGTWAVMKADVRELQSQVHGMDRTLATLVLQVARLERLWCSSFGGTLPPLDAVPGERTT